MEAVKSVESQGIGLREGEGKRRGTSTRLPVNSSNGQGLKVLSSRLDEKTTKRLGRSQWPGLGPRFSICVYNKEQTTHGIRSHARVTENSTSHFRKIYQILYFV